MKVRCRDRDTPGDIAWIKLGCDDDETEQLIYDLNPHLHQYGRILPVGVEITLPDLTSETTTEADEQVTVWS